MRIDPNNCETVPAGTGERIREALGHLIEISMLINEQWQRDPHERARLERWLRGSSALGDHTESQRQIKQMLRRDAESAFWENEHEDSRTEKVRRLLDQSIDLLDPTAQKKAASTVGAVKAA